MQYGVVASIGERGNTTELRELGVEGLEEFVCGEGKMLADATANASNSKIPKAIRGVKYQAFDIFSRDSIETITWGKCS